MKNIIFIVAVALLCVFTVPTRADLLDCNEKILPQIVGAEDSAEHQVSGFLKNMGCHIKKGAEKVSEQAKKLGVELRERAKEFGEKAKDLGRDIKGKFSNFKDKLSKEEMDGNLHGLVRNVEIIDPDLLKAEQQCGHGHILDALGNCNKLRK